jgi:hypothetical protein
MPHTWTPMPTWNPGDMPDDDALNVISETLRSCMRRTRCPRIERRMRVSGRSVGSVVVGCGGLGHQLNASRSVGMPVPQRSIGVINVYGFNPHSLRPIHGRPRGGLCWIRRDRHGKAVPYDRTAALAEQMQDALHSRAVIEQAQGIIMAKEGCTADEAFLALTKASQTQNIKLREVAQQLVADTPTTR